MRLLGNKFDDYGICHHFDTDKIKKQAVLVIDHPYKSQEAVYVYETGKKDEFGDDILVEYCSWDNSANYTVCGIERIEEVWRESWGMDDEE